MRFSHVAVNTFIPDLERVEAIAALPGVESSATYLGLSAFPVLDGQVVEDFRYTGVFGSLDGRFFTQDRATVVDGRLPRLDATDEIAFTPVQARFMKAGVGDSVTYLYRNNETQAELARTRYKLVGIVRLPPVLVDEYDIIDGAVLPPAATRERLDAFYYAWQGIRYGWNWDQLLLEQAGYGRFDPSVVTKLLDAEEDVTEWSLLAFDQMSFDGVAVPVIGLDRRAGAVEPPTVSGRPVAGPREIALGATTLSRLGKKVGDRVTLAVPLATAGVRSSPSAPVHCSPWCPPPGGPHHGGSSTAIRVGQLRWTPGYRSGHAWEDAPPAGLTRRRHMDRDRHHRRRPRRLPR